MAGYNENPENLPRTKQCQLCEHFQGYSEVMKNVTCRAFPFKIPDSYLFEDILHREIDPDQKGIFVFKQKENEPGND